MFKNDYQGGSFVELFAVVGKDPLSKLKVSSSGVTKEFCNEIRSYLINIEGEPATTHISFPKSSKQSLHAIQQYLVFQLFIYSKRSLSVEITILNQLSCKKRIIFSSNNREVVITPLYAKLPLSFVKVNSWCNLCFDLEKIVMSSFEGSRFSVIDSIVLSANCRLKRLFTLKERPDCTEDMPKNISLPDDIDVFTQVIDSFSFIESNTKLNSSVKKNLHINISNSHLAFGYRIRNQSESTAGEIFTDRQVKTSNIRNQSIGSLTEHPLKAFALDGSGINQTKKVSVPEDNKETADSNNIVSSTKLFIQPRPPKEVAGKVRRPRVKSADLSAATKTKNPLPALSKSADSRSRGESSCNSENGMLNTVQKFKTPSNSVSLFNNELKSSENTLNKQFRSKSLTILPDIKKSVSQTKEHSFSTLLLADDIFEDDYLQKCLKSNCNDALTHSSCSNSTNSDLLYSSRPHSVLTQRSHKNSETCLENIAECAVQKSSKNSILFSKENNLSTQVVCSEDKNANDANMSNKHDSSEDLKNTNKNINVNKIQISNNSSILDLSEENLVLHNSRFETEEENEKLNKTYNVAQLTNQVEDKNQVILEKILPGNLNEELKDSKLQRKVDKLPKYNPVRESYESETMSWLNSSINKSSQFPIKTDWSPKQMLRKKLEEHLGSFFQNSKEVDSDDGFSDDSDDTTFAERPLMCNHRYQDEIKSLDLSAAMPDTPQVGEQSRSKNQDLNNNSILGRKDEEFLDLLFDPVLNCYYDPKTEKYYELS
ncbi:protein CFAP20DC isoform X1 [Hydra vulgaris]|uniref:protein CFAP20DC isoform X1 n=1 Tax=Hydra vulgaris TaxID=6087 RepID=UPI001F5EA9F2|nr:protein CFAP20DC-like [Hydra vulgaris]